MNSHAPMRRYKVAIFQRHCHPAHLFVVESLVQVEEALGISHPSGSRQHATLRNNLIVDSRKNYRMVHSSLFGSQLGEIMQKMRHSFFTQVKYGMNIVAAEQATISPSVMEVHA